jgi:hypothetical protein
MDLLHFPVALYLRLFGAAGFGYIVGSIGKAQGYMALTIACFALGATLAGWLMMRQLMRDAKKAIAQRDQSKP